MTSIRMVRFTTASDAFEARVLAARLGASGVLCQLRGGGLDPTYPIGNVEVLVAEDDLPVARELFLEDEVEAVFDDETDRLTRPRLFLVALAALVLAFAFVRVLGGLLLA